MHNRDKTWRTADGRGIPIKDMQLGHLVNVINWVMDNRDSYTRDILDVMVAEANYRKTSLFAQGQNYPQKIGSRWRVIDAQTGIGAIEKPPQDYIEAVKDNTRYQNMRERTQQKRNKEQDQL